MKLIYIQSTINPLGYINNCSNHPPTVIKQLQKSIKKWLSDLLSNEKKFEKTKLTYSDALQRSGFPEKPWAYIWTKDKFDGLIFGVGGLYSGVKTLQFGIS